MNDYDINFFKEFFSHVGVLDYLLTEILKNLSCRLECILCVTYTQLDTYITFYK